MSSRKAHTSNAKGKNEVKYCSDRCRHKKPGKVDRKIERVFVELLHRRGGDGGVGLAALVRADEDQGEEKGEVARVGEILERLKQNPQKQRTKGDSRVIVQCSTVEEVMFGKRDDAHKTAGRYKKRRPRGVPDAKEWKSVDMKDSTAPTNGESESDSDSEAEDSESDGAHSIPDSVPFGAGKIRPPQDKSDVNGSVGGEKGWAERQEETEEAEEKRKEGQRWVERREMVRSAARRGVIFGFVDEGYNDTGHECRGTGKKGRKKGGGDAEGEGVAVGERRRKCEAVMNDAVVEPSYAKGEWGIRWRE
jgi:hypothetical protein